MSKKQRIGVILYTNPDYYPVTAHAVELLSKKFDVTLIGRNQEPTFWSYPDNVSVLRLGEYSSVKEKEKQSRKTKLVEYYRFIRDSARHLQDVSLIYAYDSFGYVAAYLCQGLLHKRIKIVYQNHELSENLPSLLSLSGFVERLERRWINKAEIVILPDEDRASYFTKVNALTQSPMIVPNFPPRNLVASIDNWDELIKSRWESKILFYRGTISDVSAMEEMLTASATVSDAAIRFVGFLNEAEDIRLQKIVMEQALAKRFQYLGKLPYQDLQVHTLKATLGFALYKGIDLNRTACVSACQKIYEYAACGLPVIVTDSSNYRNFLGEEIWVKFANPNDSQSVAAAISSILSDFSNYRAICLAARESFESRFNYEAVFEPVVSELKELIQV